MNFEYWFVVPGNWIQEFERQAAGRGIDAEIALTVRRFDEILRRTYTLNIQGQDLIFLKLAIPGVAFEVAV